jgi:hypothetical protein
VVTRGDGAEAAVTPFAWARRLWRRLRPSKELHTVDFSFSSEELTLSVDDFAKRYLDPAIEQLTANVEAKVIDKLGPPAPWHKRAIYRLRYLWLIHLLRRLWHRALGRKEKPGLSIDEITAKALVILHQKANLVGAINAAYDEEKAKAGVKPGASLRIRLPVQYTIKSGN